MHPPKAYPTLRPAKGRGRHQKERIGVAANAGC